MSILAWFDDEAGRWRVFFASALFWVAILGSHTLFIRDHGETLV